MNRHVLRVGDPGLAPSRDRSLAWLQIVGLRSPELRPARDRVLEALRTQEAPLDRSDRPGHLTGSALIIDPSSGRILVLFHRKLQRWLQPGGHADGDTNLAAVALREATEETGIDGLAVVIPAVDIDVHRVAPPAEDPHLHYDVRFVVMAPAGATVTGNHESEALRWVHGEELPGLGADAGLVRLARVGEAVAASLERPRS